MPAQEFNGPCGWHFLIWLISHARRRHCDAAVPQPAVDSDPCQPSASGYAEQKKRRTPSPQVVLATRLDRLDGFRDAHELGTAMRLPGSPAIPEQPRAQGAHPAMTAR